MYTYLSATGLPDHPSPKWTSVNVLNATVSSLFRQYRDVVLTLQPAGTTEEKDRVFVSMNSLRAEYALYNNTLAVLLQSLGDTALQTLPELPSSKVGYIVHSDMIQTGYQFASASAGYNYPDTISIKDLPDIEVTRPNVDTDLSLIHSHGLVSVNGYFHNTDTDGMKLWVKKGNVSASKTHQSHLGLTSFLSVGKLTKYPLTDAMVTLPEGQTNLGERMKITVPDSLDGKSFFLILGGYMVIPRDQSLWQSGDTDITLSLKSLPYVERIMESRNTIDLSSLELTENVATPDAISAEEVWSEAVIRRYLKLSQTFLVVVDTDNLFFNSIVLRRFNTPGSFSSIYEPTLPLLVGHGRTAEYWKVKEDGRWAMTVADSFMRNYFFRSMSVLDQLSVDSALDFRRPFFMSEGRLLEIGTYKK